MTRAIYDSARAVEEAFYRAFERADIELMASVWANDDRIECIHPMGARIHGRAVLSSWREMFDNFPEPVAIHRTEYNRFQQAAMAVHVITENIHFADGKQAPLCLLATNVFTDTGADGWRMIAHHASPAPRPAQATPEGGNAGALH